MVQALPDLCVVQGVAARRAGSASRRGADARAKAEAKHPAQLKLTYKKGTKGPLVGKDPIVLRPSGPKPTPQRPALQVTAPAQAKAKSGPRRVAQARKNAAQK